jgi:hypothetical protein
MVITQKDIERLQILTAKQEDKELIVRLFVSALVSGTNVTAPEIRTCTQQVINTLAEKEAREPVKPKKYAE